MSSLIPHNRLAKPRGPFDVVVLVNGVTWRRKPLIAITGRRIITASPHALLWRGELGESYPLSDVRFVGRPKKENAKIRPTVDVITEQQDLRRMFPSATNGESIDEFARVLKDVVEARTGGRMAVEELSE